MTVADELLHKRLIFIFEIITNFMDLSGLKFFSYKFIIIEI